MADTVRVRLRTVDSGPTALGEAGPFTLSVDRPAAAGGGGLGSNGGQLLYLSIVEATPIEVRATVAPRP
ncbi:MAG TPA: hypothetical protein VGQ02_07670 [Candidatus Limnocylindrales bacterium]|jgi:hypothetical protein|nr:hypothetical protein [Candidatus Limnocylindrales bacterium]